MNRARDFAAEKWLGGAGRRRPGVALTGGVGGRQLARNQLIAGPTVGHCSLARSPAGAHCERRAQVLNSAPN